MKLPFFVELQKIREFQFLLITNLIKDKKFFQNLLDSTVNEYLEIYPKYFKGYTNIKTLVGKNAANEFVYQMKPKKATKHEYVVIKRKDLDPNDNKMEQTEEEVIIFF